MRRGNVSSHEPRCGEARGIAQVGAAPADAVVLLGDVGQVEEMREGARQRDRGIDRQAGQHRRQLAEVAVGARARALGQRAHVLDALEDRLARVRPQRLAEQLAEQPDILPQRLVRIVHVRIVPAKGSCDRCAVSISSPNGPSWRLELVPEQPRSPFPDSTVHEMTRGFRPREFTRRRRRAT